MFMIKVKQNFNKVHSMLCSNKKLALTADEDREYTSYVGATPLPLQIADNHFI